MKTLYLIDASVYVFRAYFSIPSSMTDATGQPANAVYGFAGFLCQFLEQTRPAHIAVAFDKSLTTSFRNDFYPEYKARRELPPPELEAQFESCMELCQALGLPTFVDTNYEADDIIGTIAEKMRKEDMTIIVVTSDKDLAQLIRKGDTLWDFAKDRKLNDDGVRDHFGVSPEQIVDYLALVGDKVDNIPGVAGVGAKTAVALLAHFETLENLYRRIDELPALKIRAAARVAETLQNNREMAFLSQKLAQIAFDAPIHFDENTLVWKNVDFEKIDSIFDRLNFGQGIRGRVQGLRSVVS
jgi:5'-3' exonuclease